MQGKKKLQHLFSTPGSERFAFLAVGGQSGFAACPPLRKLLKPSGEQAPHPDFISFPGVLNNYKLHWKGSITLDLCLILLVLLSLIAAALRSSRLAAGRAALACAQEQGLYSMFSQYDRTLFDRYGILFLDAGYGGESLQLGRVLKQTEGDVSMVLYPKKESAFPGAVDLLRFGPVESELTGYVLATDNGGAAFRRQVCEAMRGSLGSALLEAGKQKIQAEGRTEDSLQREAGKITADRAGEFYAEDHPEGSGCQGEVTVPEHFVNPIESIRVLKKKGILPLVIPAGRQLSSGSLKPEELVSGRILQTGMNMAPSGWKGGDEEFLMREFLIQNFGCFTCQRGSASAEYQVEYVLAGKNSDVENLKAAVKKLQKLREKSNLIYLISSPQRREEAAEMAAVICASLGNPELEPAVSFALKKCWAWGESVLDLRELLDGGKIPIVKTDSSWQLSLHSLADLQSAADTQRHSSEGGLTYEEYLQILLLKIKADTLATRMMDLTELNLREENPGKKFCLDCCLDAAEVKIRTESGGQELSIDRCYGYGEQRKGLFY